MDEPKMYELAERFLGAWNTQDVQSVLDTYTPDVVYRDPNTRGEVQGSESLRHYLTRLFEDWQMHWSLRDAHLFEGGDGCAVLWHAELARKGGDKKVEVDGMDLVLVRDDRIARNEVYFDRVQLLPLLEAAI
jgi:ketosteroid isomerase-like protein